MIFFYSHHGEGWLGGGGVTTILLEIILYDMLFFFNFKVLNHTWQFIHMWSEPSFSKVWWQAYKIYHDFFYWSQCTIT